MTILGKKTKSYVKLFKSLSNMILVLVFSIKYLLTDAWNDFNVSGSYSSPLRFLTDRKYLAKYWSTLKSFQASVSRYLMEKTKTNIMLDRDFTHSRAFLSAKRKFVKFSPWLLNLEVWNIILLLFYTKVFIFFTIVIVIW
jgi:hypothetical protein